MFAVVLPSLFALLLMAVWVYALVDVITTDDVLVRNLPKIAWVLIVVFLWVIGAMLWFAAGRPAHAGLGLGLGARRTRAPNARRDEDRRRRPRRRGPRGPEDEDGWTEFPG